MDTRKEFTSKENSLHRLKIISGHIKAIQQMVEDDDYCVDIVHQSLAVQKALKKLDTVIIEEHLKTCVVDQIKSGNVEETTKELLRLYELK